MESAAKILWRSMVILLLLILKPGINHGMGDTSQVNKKKLIKPEYIIQKTNVAPKIDGVLADEVWRKAAVGSNFTQFDPKPFSASSQTTFFQLSYDDEAIYVAIQCEEEKGKVRRHMSQRDGSIFDSNTDYVSLSLDTYDDDQNGFRFVVGASGVQADARVTPNNTDFNWDGVWESKVQLNEKGWVAEYKIPFFNLRFSNKKVQKWGLQVSRVIKRLNETDTWSPLDPTVDGQAIQWGNLIGLEDLKPPLRLQFSPYIAVDYQIQGSKNEFEKNIYSTTKGISGGLDMKVGINEAFTLDATLIPNFGQVQSDNKILNLSPFEVYFQERRPFFTEGTELFNRGNIFYSRRIGGLPRKFFEAYNDLKDGEVVKNNPTETQLYNATKISGRLANKVGLGILNAVTAPMYATIDDTSNHTSRKFQTSPLTNYNVFVVDKLFKNNSTISFTNAATWRAGSDSDANVSALRVKLRDKKNKYEFYYTGRMSHIFQENKKTYSGYASEWNFGKVSGNLTWSVGQEFLDNQWNPSDLAYFQINNTFGNYFNLNYSNYEPNKIFLQSNLWVNAYVSHRYLPFDYQVANFNAGFWGKFKNQYWANYYMNIRPMENDFYESRDGSKFVKPASYQGGINMGTDDRKKIYSYFYVGLYKNSKWSTSAIDLIAEPTFRINSWFKLSASLWYSKAFNDVGYNTTHYNGTFGKRDVNTFNNSLQFNFNFNPYSNLSIRLRHYWTKLNYKEFYNKDESGNLSPIVDYNANADISQNYFNVDFIYTWQFAPGSFFNLIWKNSLDSYEAEKDNIRTQTYFNNINKLVNSPQNNHFTVKMIYFLDYNRVNKALKKI
jgi:hypothetical protein